MSTERGEREHHKLLKVTSDLTASCRDAIPPRHVRVLLHLSLSARSSAPSRGDFDPTLPFPVSPVPGQRTLWLGDTSHMSLVSCVLCHVWGLVEAVAAEPR